MRIRSFAALTLAVALLAGAMNGVAPVQAAPAAPGFRVKLLDGGRTFDSREQIGKKVLVLRFQASWCRPCVRESPAVSRVAERYHGRDVEVLALHVQDTPVDARRFVHIHRPSYPVALDPKLTIGNRFGVKGTPATIVIDRKGEIVARLNGTGAPTRLPRILDDLLAKERPRT